MSSPRKKLTMRREVSKSCGAYLDASLTEVDASCVKLQNRYTTSVSMTREDAGVVIDGADPVRDRRRTQSRRSQTEVRALEGGAEGDSRPPTFVFSEGAATTPNPTSDRACGTSDARSVRLGPSAMRLMETISKTIKRETENRIAQSSRPKPRFASWWMFPD